MVVEPEQILAGEPWIPKHIRELMEQAEKRVDVLGVIMERLFVYLAQPDVEPINGQIENFQTFLTSKEVPEDMRHNLCMRMARIKEGHNQTWLLNNDILTSQIVEVS